MLRLLWRLGPCTVKEAHEELQRERPVAYSAVLRLLQIMHGKGLLARDESRRSHVYTPALAQDAAQTSLLGDLIRKAFAGSGKALVLAALQGGHVTREERDEIEAFLRKEGDGK
jgi:predicted transcriptional regulator